ncbi:MAG: hypothetical protein RIQ81_2362 [Pseudomonadota bacterium]
MRRNMRLGHIRAVQVFVLCCLPAFAVVGVAAFASERSYEIDTSVAGATAEPASGSLGKIEGKTDGKVRILRSPSFEAGPDEPELKPKQRIVKEVSRPKVARQLKFQKMDVNGYPVEPRVRFTRETEVFDTERLQDEEIRADFLEKVTADLAP